MSFLVQLGAIVTLGQDEGTTHVLAAARDTDKVHWAVAHDRHVVSPAWLQASGTPPLDNKPDMIWFPQTQTLRLSDAPDVF